MDRTAENMAVWNAIGLIAHNDTVTLSVEAFDNALILARLQVMSGDPAYLEAALAVGGRE